MSELVGSWVKPSIELLSNVGADSIRHSGRTFLDHLVGVAELLTAWGQPETVIKAGLFHSIYGTEVFTRATVPIAERHTIRAIIGDEAEQLAYWFCVFDRASIYPAIERDPICIALRDGTSVAITRVQAEALLALIWANEVEQKDQVLRPRDSDQRALARINSLAQWLSPAALLSLRSSYGGAPTRPSKLAHLIGTERPEDFLARSWSTEWRLFEGPVARLDGLCSYSFAELCDMKVDVVRAFFHVRNGGTRMLELRAGQARAAYEAGATVYFHGLTSPRIREWIDDLNRELGLVSGLTRVSAFASLRGEGLSTHYDLNDNFVCQARGRKRFRVAPNQHVQHPLYGYTIGKPIQPVHRVEAPAGFPTAMPDGARTVDMTPGMVMFMPRGMWHDTQTTDDESLHFNIQCGLPTWRDVLDFITSRTAVPQAAELRQGIQALFLSSRDVAPGTSATLARMLREVADAIDDGTLAISQDELFRYVALRRTRLFEYPY